MKKYMLIAVIREGEELQVFTYFHNDLNEVERVRMDCKCGLGTLCEVYKCNRERGDYEFLYS